MKKFFLGLAAALLTINLAWATDINQATLEELQAAKGIGPVKAKAIVDERAKNGPFKSWVDLDKRVKGLGDKTMADMKEAGFKVGRTANADKKK
ncbi:MAG: ComEA family DNA-binding protein [Burkholderiales bacterium]|jgi:competence protein ComEA